MVISRTHQSPIFVARRDAANVRSIINPTAKCHLLTRHSIIKVVSGDHLSKQDQIPRRSRERPNAVIRVTHKDPGPPSCILVLGRILDDFCCSLMSSTSAPLSLAVCIRRSWASLPLPRLSCRNFTFYLSTILVLTWILDRRRFQSCIDWIRLRLHFLQNFGVGLSVPVWNPDSIAQPGGRRASWHFRSVFFLLLCFVHFHIPLILLSALLESWVNRVCRNSFLQLYLFTQERTTVIYVLGTHKQFLISKTCWIFRILMFHFIIFNNRNQL